MISSPIKYYYCYQRFISNNSLKTVAKFIKPYSTTTTNKENAKRLNRTIRMGCSQSIFATSRTIKISDSREQSGGGDRGKGDNTTNPTMSDGGGVGGALDDDNDEEEEEFVESGVLCTEDDLPDNQMKTYEFGGAANIERRILLVKQNGAISAVGDKCPHYGAPLVNGVLTADGRIRCQWHTICFDVRTGDIEDFACLDSLPCYQVLRNGEGEIRVRAKKTDLVANKRAPRLPPPATGQQQQHFVVVGAGPSGASCAETLRKCGFGGRITLIGAERHLPYDRIKVSKVLDFDVEKAQFRSEQWYRGAGIDVMRTTTVTAVDTGANQVHVADGPPIRYDAVYIATGLASRRLYPDLSNVYTLRTAEDAHRLHRQLAADTVDVVVVVGASFIALEVASYCASKVRRVHLVGRAATPLQDVFGERIGAALLKLFRSKGVVCHMQSGVRRVADDGHQVELVDGTVLEASVIVLGIGSTFNTQLLRAPSSGVTLRDDGSVPVDEYLRTNVPNVYAGGDIAYAPLYMKRGGGAVSAAAIGHILLAHYHGEVAAHNMMAAACVSGGGGPLKRLKTVPFFWTMLFGKGIRYAGHGTYTDIVHVGNVEELKFVAYFLDGCDQVVGVASCQQDPIVAQFVELCSQGRTLYRRDVDGEVATGGATAQCECPARPKWTTTL